MKLKLFFRCSLLLAFLLVSCDLYAAEKPPELVSFIVKVNIPKTNFIAFSHLKSQNEIAWDTETLMADSDGKLLIKTTLPFALQIIFIKGVPVFISAPQEVKMEIKGTMGGATHASFYGPAGGKQGLPYKIDSLYKISTTRLLAMNTEELAGSIKNLTERIAAMIKKAGVVKPSELSLLQQYAAMARIAVKYAYLNLHKQPNVLAGNFATWYSKEENFKGNDLSRICDLNKLSGYLASLQAGLRLINPAASIWETIIKDNNEFLIRNNILPVYYASFRLDGLTPELKEVYAKLRPNMTNVADIKTLEQTYQAYEQMEAGKAAPDFALPDAEGKLLRLSDFKGKMVVLNFWGTWCSGCVANMPLFRAVASGYKDKPDIEFITIAMEGKDDGAWDVFLKKHKMEQEINLLYNNDTKEFDFMRNIYRMLSFPRYIVIDREGNFLDSHFDHPNEKGFKEKIDKWYQEKR